MSLVFGSYFDIRVNGTAEADGEMEEPKRVEVRKYSQKGLTLLAQGSVEEALKAIQPLLSQKIPFPLLDHTGQIIGKASETQLSNLFSLFRSQRYSYCQRYRLGAEDAGQVLP